ncbi:MAG: ion transporter [Spirochaetota bacterium]
MNRTLLWETGIAVLTVYATIEIPLVIVLDLPRTGYLLGSDIVLTVCFAADLVGRFRAAREEGGESTQRYLREWFLVDLIAAIPFGTLLAVPFESLRLLRLLRLAKLARVNTAARKLRRRFNAINPSLLRMATLAFWIVMTAHLVACGWLWIGGTGDQELGHAENYLQAIYWTTTTLTTIGYGDITPRTPGQTIYTIIVQIIGAGLYGFVIGTIATLIANIDVAKAQFQEKLERIQTFLRFRNIPPELQQRVHDYFDYLWASRRGHEERAILDELPDTLRTEIAYHINREILYKVPIFRGAGEQLLRDIISKLEPCVYLPGDIVVRKGETGREMFFISKGSVEVVSADMQTVYATLTEGQFFGEIAVLLSTERTATIRAIDYCDLYKLDQTTFSDVIEKYPAFEKSIRDMAEQRRRELGL